MVRRLMLCGLTVAALACVAAPPANAHGVGVFPPASEPFGLSYGEWSAKWWKQAVRQTGEPGTPFAAGQVDCAAMGVPGIVFLVGTTGPLPVALL